MRIGATKYILALKPYQGGNASLWRLHALNNIDKHRLMVTLGTGMGQFNIGQHLRQTRRNKPPQFVTDLYFNPAKTFLVEPGQLLLIDPPDTEINEGPEVRPQVAFNEAGVCEGEPLVTELKTLSDWVQGIVVDCRRFL